jgi:TatD DNase family protein
MLKTTPADLVAMLERSKAAGVESMIITGTSLKESKDALEMAARYGALCVLILYCAKR